MHIHKPSSPCATCDETVGEWEVCQSDQICTEDEVCCTPEPTTTTCSGTACGTVVNNCGQEISCPDTCGENKTCEDNSCECKFEDDCQDESENNADENWSMDSPTYSSKFGLEWNGWIPELQAKICVEVPITLDIEWSCDLKGKKYDGDFCSINEIDKNISQTFSNTKFEEKCIGFDLTGEDAIEFLKKLATQTVKNIAKGLDLLAKAITIGTEWLITWSTDVIPDNCTICPEGE